MTADQYTAQQQQQARCCAPEEAIDRAEFIYRASFYPIDVLRQASVRYSPARGRRFAQVLENFALHLENEHVNRGDDFRLALGHIEATYRWMVERGLQ